jgi:ribokinase
VRSAVVTFGAIGALVVTTDSSVLVPAPRVDAVDTTGAGDAFTGALAVELSRGKDLTDSVGFAVRVGAATVTRGGAQGSFPTRESMVLVSEIEGASQ